MQKSIEAQRRDRMYQYLNIKAEYDYNLEKLARLENEQYIPAQRPSDGSKKVPGASDRMANAVARKIEYLDKIADDMERKSKEMNEIEDAIMALTDGLERRILTYRYIDGAEDEYRHHTWREVAKEVYGSDDESKVKLVSFAHGRALQHIKLDGKEVKNNDAD